MDGNFSDQLIRSYIQGVLNKGTLESELGRVRELLIEQTRCPHPDKGYQRGLTSRTNQLFRALLEAKALYYPNSPERKL